MGIGASAMSEQRLTILYMRVGVAINYKGHFPK